VFSVTARIAGSLARAGTLSLVHGTVRTPAFVPLATRGAVKALEAHEVGALGFEMLLGNTFHLMLAPGEEMVRAFGGIGELMRWEGPVITDSGGFQVFSMGHGGVADEIKGRGRSDGEGAVLAIGEDGVRFRSYVDGKERFLGPERSMEVQAALGSDIALVLDECTPFHVTRDYTARSTERTHRWLGRCLRWHSEHGPAEQAVYGIVQGGVEPDLRRESAQTIAASSCAGVAIGGSLGQDKAQMYEVVSWTTDELERHAPGRPRHLLGIGDIDDLIAGVELGIDTFDCAMPTRLGRHGVALVPDPAARWRVDLVKSRWSDAREPILDGCPCPACTRGYSRAYLHYLLRARELTAVRLLTLHNLSFMARVMADLREAIAAGRLADVAAALRVGAAPGEALGATSSPYSR
jgi:queuine tRNA-ribosyltransferase